LALGLVRAAQRRDDEAEKLLREALEIAFETDFDYVRYEALHALAQFLRTRGRPDEAEPLEEATVGWGPIVWGQPQLPETLAEAR
jgi:hypothetical protein